MPQLVSSLPTVQMADLHRSVAAGIACSTQFMRCAAGARIVGPPRHTRSVVVPPKQQAVVSARPARHMAIDIQASSSPSHSNNPAAARYASAARRVTAKHQMEQKTRNGQHRQEQQQQEQQHMYLAQHMAERQLQLPTPASRTPQKPPQWQRDNAVFQQSSQQTAAAARDMPMQQQLQQWPVGRQPAFVQRLQLCDVQARSHSMVDWQAAAYGLQLLVRDVASPMQAQQAWAVAVTLQARPLHKRCARVLGEAVVSLVQMSLRNHDHWVLQQLMAGRLLHFSFNKRHVDRLIQAAVTADVGLDELQALLDMMPQHTLSNRSFFVLIKSFMGRQQYTEAAHCFHQLEAAGLSLTPAMEGMMQQLKAARNVKPM